MNLYQVISRGSVTETVRAEYFYVSESGCLVFYKGKRQDGLDEPFLALGADEWNKVSKVEENNK